MNSDFKMYNQGENLVIELEISNLDQNDVKVFVEGDYLRVEGQMQVSKEANADGFYAKQEKSSKFLKQIGLPVSVKGDLAKKEFLDNKLIITIPKQ